MLLQFGGKNAHQVANFKIKAIIKSSEKYVRHLDKVHYTYFMRLNEF